MLLKHLILVTAAFAINSIANAQIQFGLKGGLNLANLGVSPTELDFSYAYKPDFHGGALVAIPLSSIFGLQPEVVYSGQGAKIKSSFGGNGTFDFGYINVPILFKYNHPSGFFAELGPQIGFLFSAKENGNGSMDVKKAFKSTDFAAVFGIGYLSSINIGIDARYNLGITNIFIQTGETFKNSVIQIGAFYLFGKGKSK